MAETQIFSQGCRVLTNYEIWLAGNGGDIKDTKLFNVFLEEWARPTKGQQLKIKGTLFEVVRTDPSSNPAGQMVKIYLEPFNRNRPFRASMNINRRMRNAVRY